MILKNTFANALGYRNVSVHQPVRDCRRYLCAIKLRRFDFYRSSNPFSTPNDPKLSFRADHLPRLYSQTIPITDSEYWSTFFTVFDTAYDVANLLPAQDVTRALLSHPENVVSLVRVLGREVERLMQDEHFPTPEKPAHAGLGAYAPSFLSKDTLAAKRDDSTRRMLNCLRVLSRIIPFVIAHEDGLLEEDVFWRPSNDESSVPRVHQSASQFVIDDEDDTPDQAAASETLMGEQATKPVLAERLISLAVDLLFVQGFTLPLKAQSGNSKVAYTIWENGIGSTVSLSASRECDSNRSEVLRFLLVLLSKTLYIPSNAYSGFSDGQPVNRWHAHLVKMPSEAKSRKRLLSLLCSLLNTSLKSGAYYASNAGGIVGTVGGAVGESYEKLVSGGKRREDPPRLALVKVAVQVLNVLLCIPTVETIQSLDMRSPPQTPAVNGNTSLSSMLSQQESSQGRGDGNGFRHYLSKLHRQSDVGFIVEVR